MKNLFAYLRSNLLFVLIIVSFILLSITFFYSLINSITYFPSNTSFATTTLGILVTLLIVFFALVQITFSINDIPTEILLKYSFRQKESYSLIGYFILCIFLIILLLTKNIDVILVFQRLIYDTYIFVVSLILVSSVLYIILYFFWFISSITSESILNKIEKRVEKSFSEITDIEKALDGHFVKFQEFIKNNVSYKLDIVSSDILGEVYPTFSLGVIKEGFVKEINFEKINECLKDLIKNKNIRVKFEVEPSMILPFKDVYFPVRNYRLLTIMFEPIERNKEIDTQLSFLERYDEIFVKEDYDKMTFDERKRYIKSSIEKVFESYTIKLFSYFKIDSYKKWKILSEKALNDFNRMIKFKIKNEQEINAHCDSLKRIVDDQLLSKQPDVYLHLKLITFITIIEHIKSVNEFAISKQNLEFFDRILKTFYPLLLKKITIAKNPLVFNDVFETINHFHGHYITNVKLPYSERVKIIMLNLCELSTRFNQQLKEETEEKNLTGFYEKVISAGGNTAFWIIKRHIDWYRVDEISNHRYLKEQFKDVVKFLEFYREDPFEYFENRHDYFKIKYLLQENENVDQKMKIQFELAEKKAALVKKLKRKLQEKIITLSIWMIYKFMRKELPPLAIWDLALPSALGSIEDRHLDSSLTELFNDYVWQEEAQRNLFEWDRIYPPGGHLVTGFNFNIYWILLNIFRNKSGSTDFFPRKIKSSFWKKELIKTFCDVQSDVWCEALDITEVSFNTVKDSYKAFVEKLEPHETD